jgi:hypothetical protein
MEDIKGIPLSKNKQLLTLLFADDQVIISNTDYLQKAVHKLNEIITMWFNYICTENKISGI